MAMVNVWPIAANGRFKHQVSVWQISWRTAGADILSLRLPEWTLAYGFVVDDNTINVGLVLLLLLIVVVVVVVVVSK